MKIEEAKKIRLLDEKENILCSLEAICTYEDNDDEVEILFVHPMTSSCVQFARMCLQGWTEQNEKDNANWWKLVECIENDDNLLSRCYDLDEVDYFL